MEGLTSLAVRAAISAQLNLTDLHIYSENFIAGFLKILFGWKLRNANEDKANVEGIDLVDDEEKVIVQVTGTCKKKKIEHSLKEISSNYSGYHFYFFPIVSRAKVQQNNSYYVPSGITFNPKTDILDITSLIKELSKADATEKLENAAAFIRKNLITIYSENENLSSGLEYVIAQLSKDGSCDTEYDVEEFQIEAKVAFNNLFYGREAIRECAGQHRNVQRIYDEYASQGQSKSKAVLHKLHLIYLKNKQQCNGDELFRKIEKDIIDSIDVTNLPDGFTNEELLMCADILMVHAFMECKIFEKPF